MRIKAFVAALLVPAVVHAQERVCEGLGRGQGLSVLGGQAHCRLVVLPDLVRLGPGLGVEPLPFLGGGS